MVCLSGFFSSISQAQNDGYVTYKLQPRDTLLSLVARYTQGPEALQQIVQANDIKNPNLLPVGFTLKIPRQILRHEPSTATVSRLNCSNITLQVGSGAVTVQTGDTLREGQVLRIPAGCQLGVMLEDGSSLRMMSGAVIKLKALRRNVLENAPEVRVELLDGRVEVDVPRKRQPGDAAFEVLTPSSVAGVRGTEFRVGFDAIVRNSQVEVLQGTVSAKGNADSQDQLANAGQGVSVTADGKALPVENLFNAPRFESAHWVDGGQQGVLRFSAPDKATMLVRQSQDASFSFFEDERRLDQPEMAVKDLGAGANFQQWASVSPTGIVGYSVNYAFCKGYLRNELLRCNIHFNFKDLNKIHLRLSKQQPNGQSTTIVDQPFESAANAQLVFRGLPPGQYQWQLQYDLGSGPRITQVGEFWVVALSARF